MLDALTITAEEAQGLAELAQLDLAMARDFAARAQAAEDPDTANELARSYQRVARSYRQTLALKVRLAREVIAVERETPRRPSGRPEGSAPARRRADALREAVTRVAFDEYEAPEQADACDFCVEMLDGLLEDRAREPGFADAPLDEQVAEICDELGLDPARAARWRELPDPPDPAAASEPDAALRDTG
jgi:hypothetical protein